MEKILTTYNFTEIADDGEAIEYSHTITATAELDDFMSDYIDTSHITEYEFCPASTYGWGFNKEILVVLYNNGNEIGDVMIPIEDFIKFFDF
jgi:hypothetical protein